MKIVNKYIIRYLMLFIYNRKIMNYNYLLFSKIVKIIKVKDRY